MYNKGVRYGAVRSRLTPSRLNPRAVPTVRVRQQKAGKTLNTVSYKIKKSITPLTTLKIMIQLKQGANEMMILVDSREVYSADEQAAYEGWQEYQEWLMTTDTMETWIESMESVSDEEIFSVVRN